MADNPQIFSELRVLGGSSDFRKESAQIIELVKNIETHFEGFKAALEVPAAAPIHRM